MRAKHILLILVFWLFCGVAGGLLVYRMQPGPDAPAAPDTQSMPDAPSTPDAQSIANEKAAKETEVPGLKVLPPEETPPRLVQNGIFIAYVTADASPGKYTCGAMSREESIEAGQTVGRALAELPDEALKKTKLKYAFVCSYAKSGGMRIGGIPVPPLRLLMLDMKGNSGGSVSARLVLHELYHYIEYRNGGIKDSGWNAKFGKGYANGYKEDLSGETHIGSGKKGFLNGYAQTFAHEERAEIFSLLMTDPGGVAGHIRGEKDEVLYGKVLYMVGKIEKLLGIEVDFPRMEL